MPDEDAVYVFAKWAHARAYLVESLQVWADGMSYSYDDVYDNEKVSDAIETIDLAIRNLMKANPNDPVNVSAFDERGYQWNHWIEESMEPPTED